MSINDVLKSVKAILQIHDDFHPLIYAIGTKDNTAIILDHLPQPHKKHEREQAFEISGIKAASTYDLGELTQVYFVRQITVQSSDDLKEKEIISMDILDLDKNTQQTFTYLIMRKEAGRQDFAPFPLPAHLKRETAKLHLTFLLLDAQEMDWRDTLVESHFFCKKMLNSVIHGQTPRCYLRLLRDTSTSKTSLSCL